MPQRPVDSPLVNRIKRVAYVFIPKGVRHSYSIAGSQPARLLILATPGGLEGFFEELREPAGELALATRQPDMQQMMPRLMAAATKYRVEILGPPPGEG